MRLGIFGGSFDPVHYGHLLLAEWAREAAQLDRVWFVPAAVAPHKSEGSIASGEARAAMLDLAASDNPALEVSRVELARGGISYTVDTLRAIRADCRGAELFLLIGADSVADLPTWREPEEICRLATLVVARRADEPDPDFAVLADLAAPERLEEFRRHVLSMPRVELSSTEIRRRAAAGESIQYQTPDGVCRYIQSHGLYRA